MKSNKPKKQFMISLGSTRLTIFLLIVLTLLSILGTLIIQKGTDEARHIHDVYSPAIIRIFSRLGFFDIYHSPLYIGALAFLFVNLIVCTYNRLPGELERMRREKQKNEFPQKIKESRYREITIDAEFEKMEDSVFPALKRFGFKPKKIRSGLWSGKKGASGRSGFYFAHLGLLIILIGGLVSSLLGIEGMIWLNPGESAESFTTMNGESVPLGFEILCEDFQIDYYPDGGVDQYRSEITIKDEQDETLTHTLLVNHPLSYGGFRLFQSSYQQTGVDKAVMEIEFKNGAKKEFMMGLNQKFEIQPPEGNPIMIEAQRFEPNFSIDASGEAYSKSDQLKNPALFLSISEKDKEPVNQWVFMMHPNFHGMKEGMDYRVIFKDLAPFYATGIQISRDPGSGFIWFGSGVLVLGLILSFFVHPYRVWTKLETVPEGTKLSLYGYPLKAKKYVNIEPLDDLMQFFRKQADASQNRKG